LAFRIARQGAVSIGHGNWNLRRQHWRRFAVQSSAGGPALIGANSAEIKTAFAGREQR
jgi:hypothetical protein